MASIHESLFDRLMHPGPEVNIDRGANLRIINIDRLSLPVHNKKTTISIMTMLLVSTSILVLASFIFACFVVFDQYSFLFSFPR